MAGTDVGLTLRQAREQQGLSLYDIAARTNISRHVLEAIERNALDEVPGGLFARSYLRSYAAEVGLDGERLITESTGDSNPDVVEQLRARFHVADRDRKNTVQLAVLIASVVCLLYILLRDLAPAFSEDAHHDEHWLHPAAVSWLDGASFRGQGGLSVAIRDLTDGPSGPVSAEV